MNPATDLGAKPETQRLLDYFYSISGLRTLSGQHSLYWQWANAGEPAIVAPDQHVKNIIGRIPAVFATDFGDGQNATQLSHTIELIKQQARAAASLRSVTTFRSLREIRIRSRVAPSRTS